MLKSFDFKIVTQIISFTRDLAITIGVSVGVYLIIQNHQAEVAALNAQIDQLKMFTYEKAEVMLSSQKDLADREKDLLSKRIKMLGGEFNFDDPKARYICLKLNE